jgi:hypothetical protein
MYENSGPVRSSRLRIRCVPSGHPPGAGEVFQQPPEDLSVATACILAMQRLQPPSEFQIGWRIGAGQQIG